MFQPPIQTPRNTGPRGRLLQRDGAGRPLQQPGAALSSVRFLWRRLLPHDRCYEGSCGESHPCGSTSVTQSNSSVSLSDTDPPRAAAAAPPPQAAAASTPEAGSSCSGRGPRQQTAVKTQKEPSSSFLSLGAHFRPVLALNSHQDDNPHRVVGEQRQAEGNQAEAHCLICCCGLKTKQRLVHMCWRPWKLQTTARRPRHGGVENDNRRRSSRQAERCSKH